MFKKKIEAICKYNNYEFLHKYSTSSTMDDTKNFLIINNKNCVFLSDKQTNGRGNRGNLWISPYGNLYCSISFDNFIGIKNHFLFSMLISISIKNTLKKFKVKKIQFKWPNDIFYQKKKFAGIISETVNVNNNQSYIIVGFGININSSPKTINYDSTYVKSFCNLRSIKEFFIVFIEILFLELDKIKKRKKQNLINSFSESLMFLNQEIEIIKPDNSIKYGIFQGINADGSLQLKNKNKIENVYNGSIKL